MNDILARFRRRCGDSRSRDGLRLRRKRCTECNAQGKNGQTHGLELGHYETCTVPPDTSNLGLRKGALAVPSRLYYIAGQSLYNFRPSLAYACVQEANCLSGWRHIFDTSLGDCDCTRAPCADLHFTKRTGSRCHDWPRVTHRLVPDRKGRSKRARRATADAAVDRNLAAGLEDSQATDRCWRARRSCRQKRFYPPHGNSNARQSRDVPLASGTLSELSRGSSLQGRPRRIGNGARWRQSRNRQIRYGTLAPDAAMAKQRPARA